MKPARPWGITVMAILTVIAGALGVLAGLAMLGGAAILGGLGGPLLGMTGTYVALAMFALSGLTLYFAWAIWHLKPRAWTLLIILSGIAIVLNLISLIGLIPGRSAMDVVGLAINLIVIYYLFRPEVKVAFRRT